MIQQNLISDSVGHLCWASVLGRIDLNRKSGVSLATALGVVGSTWFFGGCMFLDWDRCGSMEFRLKIQEI